VTYVTVTYGHARVSTDGQRVDAQVRQLRATGTGQQFRESERRHGRSRIPFSA
jgi:hypothetical protein